MPREQNNNRKSHKVGDKHDVVENQHGRNVKMRGRVVMVIGGKAYVDYDNDGVYSCRE